MLRSRRCKFVVLALWIGPDRPLSRSRSPRCQASERTHIPRTPPDATLQTFHVSHRSWWQQEPGSHNFLGGVGPNTHNFFRQCPGPPLFIPRKPCHKSGFAQQREWQWHIDTTSKINGRETAFFFASKFLTYFQPIIWARRRLTWSVFQTCIFNRRRLRIWTVNQHSAMLFFLLRFFSLAMI